jgi:hypothetical protein
MLFRVALRDYSATIWTITKPERKRQMENQKQISPTPYIDELEKDVVRLILKLQQQAKTSNTTKKG